MSELADLQKAIPKVRAERGFYSDPGKIMVLLTEEIDRYNNRIKVVKLPTV
jgi:hypothetical protein